MSGSIAKASPWLVASVFVGALALAATVLALAPLPVTFGIALLTAIFEFVLFGWLLGVGLYFNARLHSGPLVPALLPKVAFAFTLAYALFGIPLLFGQPTDSVSVAVLPLHLLAMVANFFLLWFGCSALRSFELGRRASFYDFAGPFFVVWLLCVPLPIGPFIVQSRARQLASETSAAQQSR